MRIALLLSALAADVEARNNLSRVPVRLAAGSIILFSCVQRWTQENSIIAVRLAAGDPCVLSTEIRMWHSI
eukprot:SAG31_NODE_413_length_15971_cov_7.706842_6_plen_71_part_00